MIILITILRSGVRNNFAISCKLNNSSLRFIVEARKFENHPEKQRESVKIVQTPKHVIFNNFLRFRAAKLQV